MHFNLCDNPLTIDPTDPLLEKRFFSNDLKIIALNIGKAFIVPVFIEIQSGKKILCLASSFSSTDNSIANTL